MFTPAKFVANRNEVLRAEDTAARLFQMAGMPITVNQTPKHNRYLPELREADLMYGGLSPFAEVKTDWYSATSKRVAFEFGSLRASSAPFVVYMLPTYFSAPRGRILSLEPFLETRPGGDFGNPIGLMDRSDYVRLPFVKRMN
jgi:hypothetical protein